jgi:hypothetical protein
MITLDDMRKAVRLARDVRDAVAARLSVPAGQGIESR